MVTLATTNYPQHLDWALADRPGRFDARIKFGYPKESARKEILSKYLEPFAVGKININSIIKKSDGFSGAYLQELVQTAFMLAFEEQAYDIKKAKIQDSHLTQALEILTNQRQSAKKEQGITEVKAEYYT